MIWTWSFVSCCPTLAISGQSVSSLPVFIAPQDIVGDVNVTGGHVVNALGDSHTSWRAGGTSRSSCCSSTSSSAAGWGGAEWEGRWSPIDPGEYREAVSPSDTKRIKQDVSMLGRLLTYSITTKEGKWALKSVSQVLVVAYFLPNTIFITFLFLKKRHNRLWKEENDRCIGLHGWKGVSLLHHWPHHHDSWE